MAELLASSAPFDGRWWVPDDPAQVVAGRLEREGDSWRLVLFGWLGPYDDQAPFRDFPRRLSGRVNNEHVNLLGLAPLAFTSSFQSPPYRAEMSVRTVIVGPEVAEETLFTQASVRLLNLNEWASRRPWTSEHEPDQEKGTFRHKEIYTQVPILEAEIPGAKVWLNRTLGYDHSSLSRVVMESSESVSFIFDTALDLGAIEHDYVRPLRYLVELASGVPSGVSQLHVWPEGAKRLDPIGQVLSAVEAQGSASPRPWIRFFFRLDSVDFDQVVPRWWALHKEIGPVSDLIASLRDSSRNISNRFLDAASAIEGYHRHKFPEENKKTFAQRVDAVVAVADQRFAAVVGDPVKWRNWVRDGRDSVAHRDPTMVDIEREWRTTVGVADSMQWLLVLVLLAELQIPDGTVNEGLRQDRTLEGLARYLESVQPDWFD